MSRCIACNFAKKYTLVVIAIFSLLMFVFGMNLIAVGKSYSKHVSHQMTYNITEYNEVDNEQLCRISNCSYVIKDYSNMQMVYTAALNEAKGLKLIRNYNQTVDLYHLFDEYYISDTLDIILYVEGADAYFALDLSVLVDELKLAYMITFTMVFLISISFMYFSYKKEMREHMIQTVGAEAIISNQSMILITENVHHEMNTPMEVIDNKIEKIHRIVNEFIVSELENNEPITEERVALNKKLITLEKDFEYVNTAIEQIFVTLDRMRGFKHLRYSNGNKTLYDICYGACKMITIANSGFDFEVDKELENYKIKPNGTKTLKNVDLLNAIINHLKNSLEAKSSNIIICFNKVIGNTLYLNIIDNGNGIPKEALPNVFKENYSTKGTHEPRGNGMHISKYFILNPFGGDVNVVDTNSNGTIISISLQAYYEEKKIY